MASLVCGDGVDDDGVGVGGVDRACGSAVDDDGSGVDDGVDSLEIEPLID